MVSTSGASSRRPLAGALIPLVDIGMDVFALEPGVHAIAGQVILSMPGHPCMSCLGFLNERTLTRDAAAYSAAGPRPQVVWSNAVLAATAVGLAVDLLTDWSGSLRGHVYLSYRGSAGTLVPNARLPFVAPRCEHYPLSECGAPRFRAL